MTKFSHNQANMCIVWFVTKCIAFQSTLTKYVYYPYDSVYINSVVHLSYIRSFKYTGILYDRKPSLFVLMWACFIMLCKRLADSLVQYNLVKVKGNELIHIEFHDGRKVITNHDFHVDDLRDPNLNFKPIFLCAELVVKHSNSSVSHFDVTSFMNMYNMSFTRIIFKDGVAFRVYDIARIAYALHYMSHAVSDDESVELHVTDLNSLQDRVIYDEFSL